MIDPDDDDYEVLPPPVSVPKEPPKPLPRLWKTDQGPEATPADPVGAPPRAPGAPGSPPVQGGARPPARGTPPASPAARSPKPADTRGDEPPRRREPRAAEPERRSEPKRPPAARDAPRDRVLIEETPEFDTYEARQRVRTIIGATIGLAAVAGIVMLVLPYLSSGEEDFENLPDEGVAAAKSGGGKPKEQPSEAEAQNMLGNARLLAKNKKTDEAVKLLDKLVASYPNTKASGAARDALARPKKNPPLPLFLDEAKSTVVADEAGKPPVEPEPAAPSVAAVDTVPPRGAPGAAVGEANLTLPRNPAEPGAAPAAPGGASTTAARELPPGFSVREGSGIHPSGWPLQITSDRDGSPMVFIPAGSFTMGRDDGLPDEGPAHQVRLSPYYIDLHEVTVRQFEIYIKETGSRPPGLPKREAGKKASATDELPVVNVTAREAVSFLEWAGKRLPTEAQWEKAARTTDGRPFPWGGVEPTWVRPRKSKQIDPIMTYELDQSPYGVYDMAGNAWEWTADYFEPGYFKQFRETAAVDPIGPTPKSRTPQLVLKGGSKTFHAAWREGLKPETRYPFVGFRGALNVAGGEEVAAPAPTPASVSTPTLRPAPSAPASKNSRPPATRSGVVPF